MGSDCIKYVFWLPESLVISEIINTFIMPLVINNIIDDNLFKIDLDMICLVYYLNTQVGVIKLLGFFWGIISFDFLELISGESMESRGTNVLF